MTQASVSLSICIFSPQEYDLTDEIERADEFTVFAPTDAAINEYLRNTAVLALVPNTTTFVTLKPFFSPSGRILQYKVLKNGVGQNNS